MNVVLLQPEIPANTGNIGRLCVVTASTLHLIRPLGFFLDDRRRKRAGMDYWQNLDLRIHDSWDDFAAIPKLGRLYFVETGSSLNYTDVKYGPDDWLIFGSESGGIPPAILASGLGTHVSLPMAAPRSLNLANAVSIVVYEAWRQNQFASW